MATGSSCTAGSTYSQSRTAGCTKASLFGGTEGYARCLQQYDNPAMRRRRRAWLSRSVGCPYVVFEGHGPRYGDLWCRVSPIAHTTGHVCKHDAAKFCHVITLRAGLRNGSYLRVDDQAPDASTTTLNPRHESVCRSANTVLAGG